MADEIITTQIVDLLTEIRDRVADLEEGKRSDAPADSDAGVGPLFESFPSGVLVLERGSSGELLLKEANEEACKLIALNKRTDVGEDFETIWPNADEEALTEALAKTLGNGGPYANPKVRFSNDDFYRDLWIRAFRIGKDRLAVWFEDVAGSGAAPSLAAEVRSAGDDDTTTENVTLRRKLDDLARTAEELRQEAGRYRRLIRGAPVGLISCNKDGSIAELNPEAVQILGSPSEDAAKSMNLLTFPPLVQLGISEPLQQCLETGRPFTKDFRYRGILGKRTWARVHMAAVRNDAGEITGAQLVMQDISAQRLQQDLQLRSERLKAVGAMAEGIADNFGTLIQDMADASQAALACLQLDNFTEVKPLLTQIHESILTAEQRLRRLEQLALSHPKSVITHGTVFDLNDAVQEGVQRSEIHSSVVTDPSAVQYSVNLRLSDNCYVAGERAGLIDVVANLINNAKESMPSGGTVQVRTAVEGKEVVLEVEDEGKGIHKKDLGRIFEPFWTSKDGHSGMGLAVNLGIVHRHGGIIFVRSKKKRGTTVTARLPLAKKPVAQESILPDGWTMDAVRK